MGQNEVGIMKRILVCLLLVVNLTVYLGAGSIAVTSLKIGRELLTEKSNVVFRFLGQDVHLQGESLHSLKRTFKVYDYSLLPFENRLVLYNASKRPINKAMLMNLVQGFGQGSALQKDVVGQTFGQIADWTAGTAIVTGAGIYLFDYLLLPLLDQESTQPEKSKNLAILLMKYGAILFAGERLIQAVIPLPYGLIYNSTLRKGLGVSKNGDDAFAFTLSMMPDFSMRFAATVKL